MRIKMIPLETRISMLQTCLNVSGDSFHGKRPTPEKLLAHSSKLYIGMMKQIESTEDRSKVIRFQVPKTTKQSKANKKSAAELLKSLKKGKKK
jgi:uncharacterized protein YecE (DUF72 family)